MLSKNDNELVTRVGPGTPMRSLMREYWVPAMLSSEVPAPDSDPATGWTCLGVHGTETTAPEAAGPRAKHAPGRAGCDHRDPARMQLAPGPGGRHRHQPPGLSAPGSRPACGHPRRHIRVLHRQ